MTDPQERNGSPKDEIRKAPAIEWKLHEGRDLCALFTNASLHPQPYLVAGTWQDPECVCMCVFSAHALPISWPEEQNYELGRMIKNYSVL